MRYNPDNNKHMIQLYKDAALEGDDCPVDDICDSIPDLLDHLQALKGQVREYKSTIQRIEAEKRDLERRLNNTRSQKFRIAKKRGKK